MKLLSHSLYHCTLSVMWFMRRYVEDATYTPISRDRYAWGILKWFKHVVNILPGFKICQLRVEYIGPNNQRINLFKYIFEPLFSIASRKQGSEL